MKKARHEKHQSDITCLLQPYFVGWENYLLTNTIKRDLQRIKKEKSNNHSAHILLKQYLTAVYIHEKILNEKKLKALITMRDDLIKLNIKFVKYEDAVKLAEEGIAKAEKSVIDLIRTNNDKITQILFNRLEQLYNSLDENIKIYFDKRMDLLEQLIQFIQDIIINENIDAIRLENNIDKYVSDFFKQAITNENIQIIMKEEGITIDALEEQMRLYIDLNRLKTILTLKLELTQKNKPVKKVEDSKKTTPEEDYKNLLLEHILDSNSMGFYLILPLNSLKTLTDLAITIKQSDCVMKKPEVSEILIKKLHERIAELTVLTDLPSIANSPYLTFSPKILCATSHVEPIMEKKTSALNSLK